MDDPRFKKLKEDPKYRNIPKGIRKIDVSKDDRFKNIFTDKKFANKLKIDEFGNKIKENNKFNKELEDYYTEGKVIIENKSKVIQKDKGSKQRNNDKKSDNKLFNKKEDINKKSQFNEEFEDSNSNSIDESIEESDVSNDYDNDNDEFDFNSDDYRNESDSSDTSDQFEEFLNKQTDLETVEQDVWDKHKDNDIAFGDSTRRISVVNLDWDHITAKNLFTLFNSLSNKENSIKSVSIYPSDYGLEEMKKEKMQGPDSNIFKTNNKEKSNEVFIHDLNELNKKEKMNEYEIFDQAKLREYELKKLKYYYAVVELNSLSAANYIYDNFDGMEVERTQMFLDLRFVPEDLKFPHKPKDICTSLPSEYEQLKTNRALNHTKVKLTWDQTDDKRNKLIQKTFKENFKEDEIQELLVSSDDDSIDENDKNLAKFLLEQEDDDNMKNDIKILNNNRKNKDYSNKNGKIKKGNIIEEKDVDVVFEIGLEGMDKKIIREVVPDIKDKSLFEQYKERKKIIAKERKMEEKLKIDEKKKRRHQDKMFYDKNDNDKNNYDKNLDLLLEESKSNNLENRKSAKDSRFDAIKTNKNYWIDPTNKNYKTKG